MSAQNYWNLLKQAEQNTKAQLKLVGEDSRPDSDFNEKELELGIKEELEHTK